ncbi:FAD-dependent oxidoreductase [Microbacterium sp. ZW T6_19]|uniref:FAD-dependent oxidoreductase n=1 Tax=Microbacterium sp. ZW T6_19 TaxID=3378082 RepID=UPI0038533369
MPDHDVIVVGAGPVGLLAACLLLQKGLDVVVCEKHSGQDPRTRAIGIHPPGLRALDEAGIGEKVRAEALALRGGDVLSRGRMLASVDFADDRRIMILPQRRTGTLLRERLVRLDSDALRLGCSAISARDEGDFARLTVEIGGSHAELTASLIVAADGVRSPLREGLDVPWRAGAGAATYAMLDVPDASAVDRARLHCEPGGLVECFPLTDGTRRWVAREADGPLGDVDAFRAAIRGRTGVDLQVPPGARPVVFRAAQHRADRAVLGRIVLLGDAAHEVSPIGGQGMNLGWVAAQRLAHAIGDLGGTGAPDLREVERRNARTARKVQRRAHFYMSMGAPAEGARLGARERLIRTLGSPPLRGRMAAMITMARL